MPSAPESASSSSPVCSPARISIPSGRTASRMRAGAADGARGAVEGREDAVAGEPGLLAPCAFQLGADDRVVSREQLLPARVAELGGPLGRADDVREQHGREHAVRLARAPRPRDELLDLVDELVLCCPRTGSGRSLEARRASRSGCAPRGTGRPRPAPTVSSRPVQDERRHPDRREDVADVDLHRHVEPRPRGGGRAGEAAGLGVPAAERAGRRPGSAPCGRRRTSRRRPSGSRRRRGCAAAPRRRCPTGSRAPSARRAYEAPRMSPLVRSGNVAAKSAHIGPPSAPPNRNARSDPAASRTARMSSSISSNDPSSRIAVGEPGAAPVEDDQARERREPLEQVGVRRPRPVLLEVRHVAGHPEQVDRPVADDLVGDPELAAARVASSRAPRRNSRIPDRSCRRRTASRGAR